MATGVMSIGSCKRRRVVAIALASSAVSLFFLFSSVSTAEFSIFSSRMPDITTAV